MWKLLLITVLTASYTTVNSCSKPGPVTNIILNCKDQSTCYAKSALPKEVRTSPFIVTIERINDDSIACPAVIVDNLWVAGYEHCLMALLENRRAGDFDLIASTNNSGQQSIVEVIKFKFEEEDDAVKDGIALIKLETKLVFSDTIHPAYLFTVDSKTDANLSQIDISASLDWIQETIGANGRSGRSEFEEHSSEK